jgi:hypothetical protein
MWLWYLQRQFKGQCMQHLTPAISKYVPLDVPWTVSYWCLTLPCWEDCWSCSVFPPRIILDCYGLIHCLCVRPFCYIYAVLYGKVLVHAWQAIVLLIHISVYSVCNSISVSTFRWPDTGTNITTCTGQHTTTCVAITTMRIQGSMRVLLECAVRSKQRKHRERR